MAHELLLLHCSITGYIPYPHCLPKGGKWGVEILDIVTFKEPYIFIEVDGVQSKG